ncbi:HlyD family efflux transporter periplasmic adaptor subunit [Alteromonas sp. D210916BOD_24]|uniref:HlyD family secretion protein n=1 Tax=Alteromonas sp. D210916BOD_24 TaxID=3157618 RepID=UPI00399D3A46
MRKGLFRQEVIDRQSNTLNGRLLMTPRPAYVLITGVLTAWVIAVVLYINFQSYTRKTSVQGWLEPQSGTFKLYAPPQAGKIERVLVQEGELVKKGSVLLHINYSDRDDMGNSFSATLLQELNEQRQRIQDNLDRLQSVHNSEIATIENRLANLNQTYREINEIAALAKQQWNIAIRHYDNAKILQSDGHISLAELAQQQLQHLSAEQQYLRAQQDRRDFLTEIQTLTKQLNSLPQQHQNQLATLENTLSDLNQRIVSHKNSFEEIIYAPYEGVVSGLSIYPGQSTEASSLLLTLLPPNTPILAKMMVPVRAAGFIEEGQSLQIRYDAFPYQKFGLQQGQVTNISHTIVLPGELRSLPISINEPAYVVTAILKSQQIIAYGKKVTLKAGMTFSADVQLSQRTLMEWLLEPLFSIKGKL